MTREANQPSPINHAPLTVWCNAAFPDPVMADLRGRLAPHRLVLPKALQTSNLVGSGPDELLQGADIAFGQPHPAQVADLTRLRWVHLTTAGYTRYDNADVRHAIGSRGAALTNSSSVYNDPCAQHALAMILALARQLPLCWSEQHSTRDWKSAHHRLRSRLLTGQSALIFGYGAIARRLTELLAPLGMHLSGVRRRPRGDEPIPMVATERSDDLLSRADHVVNILPASNDTEGYFDARRLGSMKRGAIFYNIGRGNTVDQTALQSALNSGKLAAAYLDVTDPEPLPPDHPLWTAPNCYITPHTAGGHADEFARLAEHFLANFERLKAGKQLLDRVI